MVNTRPKNAATHPGQIVLDADADGKKKCRSPAEIKREQEVKARARMEAEENFIKGIQAAAQLEDQINAMESAKRANAARPKATGNTMAIPTVPTTVQVHGDAGLEESQHSMTLFSDEEDHAADPNYESRDEEEDHEDAYYDSDTNSYSGTIDRSEPANVRMARLEKELAKLRGMATPLPGVKGKGVEAKISLKKKLDLSGRSKKRPSEESNIVNVKDKVARTIASAGSSKDVHAQSTSHTSPFPTIGKPRAASKLVAPPQTATI
ncbi:hypothetical protein BOTBODRAFT_180734 [Botryobasidium botryosum FD-172 SS1]|uniref:Uncharacterized protein n=1 Tax=Botryobasidium botryosum (strain FD-172 SS1) TaxID=930990 RepID=A0A067LYF3_BOTB1|nr:hypothetical protein BOTBODRAFT_180734 [Botryobasidium botryosum FD-172 SS1]